MIIIGLTGSIGMGKSGAAAMLQALGLPVFDSDACARTLLGPKGQAFEAVALTFPDCWDTKRRVIDRQKLAAIVFHDEAQRLKLEAIIHPYVWQAQREFLKEARARKAKLAVLDIPLLYETGAERRCDVVICVSAPFFIQRQRVLSRPNMDEDKFYAILSRQIPQEEKNKMADYVVQTGLGRAHTFRALKIMVKELEKRVQHYA